MIWLPDLGGGGAFPELGPPPRGIPRAPGLEGVDFYFRMMVDHLIPLLGRDRLAVGDFFSGQFAFQVSGVWPMQTLLNPKYLITPEVAKNYGISVFPPGRGQVTFLGKQSGDRQYLPAPARGLEADQIPHGRNPSAAQPQIGMLPSRYSALEELLQSAPTAVADVFRHSLRVARTLPCAATLGRSSGSWPRVRASDDGGARKPLFAGSAPAQMADAAKEAITSCPCMSDHRTLQRIREEFHASGSTIRSGERLWSLAQSGRRFDLLSHALLYSANR